MRNRVTLAIASFGLALLFLALDAFNVNLVLGQTRVAIYPVAFFGLVGVVLLMRPLFDRDRDGDHPKRPRI